VVRVFAGAKNGEKKLVMNYQPSQGLQQFKNLVGIKFQLYNSLIYLSSFSSYRENGYPVIVVADDL
jgi:hypothetical protein